MSFCGKCGASIPDGSKFCPKCGNPMVSQVNSPEPGVPNPGVTGEFPPVDPAPQPEPAPFNYNQYDNQYGSSGGSGYSGPSYEPGKKGSGKLVLILVIAIVAIVAVILILLFTTGILGGGRSSGSAYEKPVQKLMNAIEDQDAQLVVDVLPDEIVDLQLEYYEDEEELADDLASYIFSDFEGYDSIKVSYKVTDREQLDDDEIDDLIDDYSYNLDVDLDITDAYDLDLDVDFKADGEKESESLSLTVIKIDGSWYLDLFSL
jgi:hypothetical protein